MSPEDRAGRVRTAMSLVGVVMMLYGVFALRGRNLMMIAGGLMLLILALFDRDPVKVREEVPYHMPRDRRE